MWLVLSSSAKGKGVCVMFWWGFCLVLRDVSQYVCVTKGKWVEGQGDFWRSSGNQKADCADRQCQSDYYHEQCFSVELEQVMFPESGTRAVGASAVVIIVPLLLSLLTLWLYYLTMQSYCGFDPWSAKLQMSSFFFFLILVQRKAIKKNSSRRDWSPVFSAVIND